MIDSASGAPSNYEELFTEYFGFVKGLVIKAGIEPQEVEQVAMSIITTFLEKDALSWYDPEKLHDVGDTPRIAGPRHRKARFSSFLGRFVSLYVRQYLDKQRTRSYKEPLRCETPLVTGDGTMTWLDLNSPVVMPDRSSEWWAWVESTQEYLNDLDQSEPRKYALSQLFRLLVEQVTLDGVADRSVIAKEYGVSTTKVSQMMQDLRAVLKDSGYVRENAMGKAII